MLRNLTAGTAAVDRVGPSQSGQLRALAATWLQRRRSRNGLAQLDDRLLRDIGLTRAEAFAEAATPFWKPLVRLEWK
jgi:uncharacterized protein YjiS (DUF1127 family)